MTTLGTFYETIRVEVKKLESLIWMNNLSEAMLFIGGFFNLGFAIFHLMFWRIFRWKEDLASLTRINRSVMQILNLCLTFLFFVMAYVSLFHSREMMTTSLGRTLLTAFALFWFLRMLEQILFFRIKNRVSFVLTLIFLLGSIIYIVPVLSYKKEILENLIGYGGSSNCFV